MGGGSGELQYWWQVSWVDLDPDIHERINNRNKNDPEKLYINELELAALVVNFFAASAAYDNNHMEFAWQPVFECGGDNTSANCWYTKFSTANKFAGGLTKLLAMGQKYLGIDLRIVHVRGKRTGFADAVSRGIPTNTLETHLQKDFPTNDSVLTCLQVNQSANQAALHRFHPSPLLLSHVRCILLGKPTHNLPNLCKRNSGRIVAEQTITFNFAASPWEWTLG